MDRIGGDVERQLARFEGGGSMPRIVAAWPAAVGGEVARNSWPARVGRDGTLQVHTSSAVWAFELAQLAPRILERLRAELGETAPRALRFAPGHLPEPAPAPPDARCSRPVGVSAEAVDRAAALAAGIASEELRKTVERTLSLGLSAHPDDRSL